VRIQLATATTLEATDQELTASEQAACGLLPGEERRGDFRAGRLAARRAAARLSAPVHVSVTHRDGLAAAVAAPAGVRPGVDLERVGAVAGAHARYFLTPRERRAGRFDPTILWSLKEAAWKALRLKPGTPLTALELEFDPHGRLGALRLAGTPHRARATLVPSWPGYVLAIVAVEDR